MNDKQENGNEETGENVQPEVDMKTKLACVWNNMKYGWSMKMKTNFRLDSPIWLLGQFYNCSRSEQQTSKSADSNSTFDLFKRDFASRIWLTYRHDFPVLADTVLTTDVGWGCMLRTGQMVLAQALAMHILGRGWRLCDLSRAAQHKEILRLFGDHPSDLSPFSLHQLVRLGRCMGKTPPEWYGPASVAHVLRTAVNEVNEVHESSPNYCHNSLLSNFTVYVAQDCTVYKRDILALCSAPTTSGSTEWQHAVLIVVPVRLGSEKLNTVYLPCVRVVLSHRLCVGIMGGRPKHSLYFIGWQDEKLLYLDPHFSQPTVDVRPQHFPIDTFHCMSPRKMAAERMDPSCALCFYCQTQADLDCFITDLLQLTSPPGEHNLYPMFAFHEGSSDDANGAMQSEGPEIRLGVVHTDRTGRRRQASKADEFIML